MQGTGYEPLAMQGILDTYWGTLSGFWIDQPNPFLGLVIFSCLEMHIMYP